MDLSLTLAQSLAIAYTKDIGPIKRTLDSVKPKSAKWWKLIEVF